MSEVIPLFSERRKTPRPYQSNALANIANEWRAGRKRVLLVSPTGSGKSLMSHEAAYRAISRGKRVLFVADRCLLVNQCYKEAIDYGLDAGIIMSKYGTDLSKPFQVASKDTLQSWLIDNQKIKFKQPFDLLIFDEAHRSINTSHQAIMNLWPDAYRIGLTATPIASNNRGMSDYYDAMVVAATYSELLAMGNLVNGRCYVPNTVDLSGVKRNRRTGEYDEAALAKIFTNKNLIGDPVQHWIDYLSGRKTIVYGVNCKHSAALAHSFNRAGIKARHVDNKTDKLELMKEILPALACGDLDIVCNVDLLTEGIDVPAVDGIQLVTAVGSLRKLLQIYGRAMRPAPDKKDFILLDHGGGVLRHVRPGTDIDWVFESSAKETTQEVIEKQKKEGKIAPSVVCPSCNSEHGAAKQCPWCGHVYTHFQKREDVAMNSGRLVEHVEEGQPREEFNARVMYQKKWTQILFQAANKGESFNIAARWFSSTCGLAPWEAGVTPTPGRNKEDWKKKISDLYPGFCTRKKKAAAT